MMGGLLMKNKTLKEYVGRKLATTVVLILLSIICGLVFIYGSNFGNSAEYDEFNFSLEGNLSKTDSISLKTDYIRMNGLRKLEADEIYIESESCLRLTNFEGEYRFQTEEIIAKASGFETCELTAKTNLNIDMEAPELKNLSMDGLSEPHNFELNFDDLHLINNDQLETYQVENQDLDIKDYEGRLILDTEGGITLDGEGEITSDGEIFEEN